MSTGGSSDSLVVRTVELIPFIQQALDEFNADHEHFDYRAGQGKNQRQFGAWNWIEQETGIPLRSLYRIFRQETKTTALEIADRLLQGLGYPHAIPSGMVKVIPNPQWSQEKWVRYMRERGCEPDDFLD